MSLCFFVFYVLLILIFRVGHYIEKKKKLNVFFCLLSFDSLFSRMSLG